MRVCRSCAGTPADGAIFAAVRAGLCDDCLAEKRRRRDVFHLPGFPPTSPPLVRRASYRAKLRSRQRNPQLDLLDPITPSP